MSSTTPLSSFEIMNRGKVEVEVLLPQGGLVLIPDSKSHVFHAKGLYKVIAEKKVVFTIKVNTGIEIEPGQESVRGVDITVSALNRMSLPGPSGLQAEMLMPRAVTRETGGRWYVYVPGLCGTAGAVWLQVSVTWQWKGSRCLPSGYHPGISPVVTANYAF